MGYRYDEFAPGELYHVFTRGIERRDIFLSNQDRLRFLDLLVYYMTQEKPMSFSTAIKLKQQQAVKTAENGGLVNLLCYCLMDNHVHLLLHENTEHGISTYMQRVLNAYARYFNIKQDRSGSLFLHPFKAVLIDGDEQFLHVSRYIHLNPFVAHLVSNPNAYQWHSLNEYLKPKRGNRCHTTLLGDMMQPTDYQRFIADEADYQQSLEDTQHLLIDYE